MAVRLFIEDRAALSALCPDIEERPDRQRVAAVCIQPWAAAGGEWEPGDIVIEAFGCGLPEPCIAAIAARRPAPVWAVLEYLSAEAWVASCHGRPSPQPRWGTDRWFYFPGFTPGTGGLLREKDLLARREAFSPQEADAFWRGLGFPAPASGARVVSMFAYPDAPLAELALCWEQGTSPTVLALPVQPAAAALLARLGESPGPVPRTLGRGALEVRLLPFLPQGGFDTLLWACHVNFVRGEDSFVRAQWAQRPFVWDIYRQDEEAHLAKLDAFLELYCAGLAAPAATAVRDLWGAWNRVQGAGSLHRAWDAFTNQELILGAHSRAWAERLGSGPDLAEGLARFCEDRLK